MREKMVKTLLKLGLIANPKDVDNNPGLLNTAVKEGYLKIVEDLLKYGVDVNMGDNSNYGLTPLHIAVNSKQVKMVKLLISHRANVNAEDEDEQTPIECAVERKATEITKLLLINGANIKGYRKLLYTTVKYGKLTILEQLLKYGADVNMELHHVYSWTPLHVAVQRGRVNIAKLLINYGANLNLKDFDDMTPIEYAVDREITKITKLLLANGADIKELPELLSTAVRTGNLKIVEELLKHGADGRTTLHFASRNGHEEVVKTLLEYGSNVNIISKKNHTPLEYARLVLMDSDVEYNIDDDDDYHYNLWNDENLSYTNNSPTSNLLKQHIAKMKAAGLHVNQRNLQGISNDHEINNFIYKCAAEIGIMKSKKIGNSFTSFYDILTKSSSELAINKSIVEALKLDDYKTKFPIYASMIDSRFRRGICRKRKATGTC